jgi:hypothetical protein
MEVGLAHTVLGTRESRVQGEGARQSETGLGQHWPYMRRRVKVSTQLVQIAKKAELDRKVRFTSLAHLLTPEFLKETWKTINRHGAGGVDGESIEQFESELEQRVQEICVQLRAGAYRAPPVRRVEIPKGPGKAGTRPLGIPTVATACFKRRWRAFSKRFSKQTSATSAMDIGLGEALITRCVRYACRS